MGNQALGDFRRHLRNVETPGQKIGRRGRAGVLLVASLVLYWLARSEALGVQILALAACFRAAVTLFPVIGVRPLVLLLLAVTFPGLFLWASGDFRLDLVLPIFDAIELNPWAFAVAEFVLVGSAIADWLELRADKSRAGGGSATV